MGGSSSSRRSASTVEDEERRQWRSEQLAGLSKKEKMAHEGDEEERLGGGISAEQDTKERRELLQVGGLDAAGNGKMAAVIAEEQEGSDSGTEDGPSDDPEFNMDPHYYGADAPMQGTRPLYTVSPAAIEEVATPLIPTRGSDESDAIYSENDLVSDGERKTAPKPDPTLRPEERALDVERRELHRLYMQPLVMPNRPLLSPDMALLDLSQTHNVSTIIGCAHS